MNSLNNGAQGYDPSSQAYYHDEYYGGGGASQMYQDASGGSVVFADGNLVGVAGAYQQPSYGDDTLNTSAYYPQQSYEYGQQQEPGVWDHTLPQHAQMSHHEYAPHQMPLPQHQAAETTEPGNYALLNEFAPRIFDYPVSSLAYDTAYNAIYVASTTQSMSSTRWRNNRASMLVTHSTTDGMLYSSVYGHPEASSSTLQATYRCLYGIAKTVPLANRQHTPPHAYRAPYGGSNVDAAPALIPNTAGGGLTKQGHIGINSLLPLNGYVASVSPAAVRLHSHGGLQLHDHNIEGMICGTIHPHSDEGMATHISVGGIPVDGSPKHKKYEVYCMDIWQGLRIVSSRAFKDSYSNKVGVTAMATSQERGSIIAGCSDGNIRILDGSLRELATVKSHAGGVSSIAVAEDGMLVATTGFGSRISAERDTSVLYAFPDPTVYLYDIRYLGRGGMSHPFAGLRGGPRFLSFLPDMDDLPSSRLLVGSGQPGGGLQIMVPFEAQNEKSATFILPQLEQGESISSLARKPEGELSLGTSAGRVLQYQLVGYDPSVRKAPTSARGQTGNSKIFTPSGSMGKSSHQAPSVPQKEMRELEVPSFLPPIPPVSLDPSLLQANDPNMRNGPNDKFKSLFTSYVLQADPKISFVGSSAEEAMTTFGALGARPIVAASKRSVATSLLNEASQEAGDYLVTIPTSKLDVDLLAEHGSLSRRYKPHKKPKEPIPNPNKLLYTAKLSSMFYENGFNLRKQRRGQRSNGSAGGGETYEQEVPQRYRLQLRPNFKSAGAFDSADFNNSGLFPGWEYAPTMPNAFAPSVLLLLYFVPEVRAAILGAQCNDKLLASRSYEKALSPELGFMFHQVECLSRYGLSSPGKTLKPRISAFVPSNFLTALSTMPEAEQLQILDGSPAAVDSPRRPEAFYRFLAYQLDKELSNNKEAKLMDSLHGIDFMSINQFITGSSPSSQSTTRALTVDLAYENVARNDGKSAIRFGEVLQHALCRETRLRAWSQKSKAYETIVQRKIATSLPKILTLSCSCAGRKEEDGLWAWRTDAGIGQWLPEFVEVEIERNGNISVKELQIGKEGDGKGNEEWVEFRGKSLLPESISKIVANTSSVRKYRYRLEAVISFVRDDIDTNDEDDEHPGHHVLHARIPRGYKKRAMEQQQKEAAQLALHKPDSSKLVLTANTELDIFRKRAEEAGKKIAVTKEDTTDDWVLFNGFVVSNTQVEDAKAFHVSFKEPCLVVFRSVEDDTEDIQLNTPDPCKIPLQVMNARSLATNGNSWREFNPGSNFGEGSLIAFDAEFVSVQEEESILTESGSKVNIRETRHALARISVLDCANRTVVLDDYVLPREHVVDYLTRFSGIIAQDLDPTKTSHNLISTRSAYLKLRYLMEQGCIFVGHGLRQDFATVNLTVPPNQILDTVEIYHQPGMRYLSLRFLANHVLGRDMQQDVHDSIEDASAAFELYEKALAWKNEGVFDERLQKLYELGQKTDWKLGVETLPVHHQ